MNAAIIDKETNVISDVIVWNQGSNWPVPEGQYLVPIENYMDIGIGQMYDPVTQTFILPRPWDAMPEDVEEVVAEPEVI
jgi:hypothetical protein